MALAPLRTGPHTVRADRLAFAAPVPVREAGGAGHWVTVGHHGEDAEGGGVHIFISSGGTVEKGPRGLLGHHIGAVASHPGAGKVKHHPAGHEPPGARDHPHYAEAPPNAERQTPSPNAGQEAAKRPGKPYARLHGAEQGTRHEQIGKALSEAQEAAKGAKVAQAQQQPARGSYRALGSEAWSPETHAEVQGTQLTDAHRSFFREHPHILDAIRQSTGEGAFETKAPSLASSSSRRTRLTPEENARRFKDYQDVKALGFLHHERGIEPRIRGRLWTHGQKFLQEQHEVGQSTTASTGAKRATGFDNPVSATARMADKSAASAERSGGRPADMAAAKEQLRTKVEAARAAKAARQQQADVADTAVAHQQAQAELAAHRAKADRNPNPWAPHLSPPVGDAKDKELAEKATRAQLAHQAAQAQQQGEAQQQQTEAQQGQHVNHYKMLLHHQQGRADLMRLAQRVRSEGAHTAAQAGPLDTLIDKIPALHSALTRSASSHPGAAAGLQAEADKHTADLHKAIAGAHPALSAADTGINSTRHHATTIASEKPRRDDIRQQQGAQQAQQQEGQRAHEKDMVRLKAETAQPKPAFSAPQPKAQEKPQTAPQPEQAAGARAPRPSAAAKQSALEHVHRELGDSDVHAPTHKDITRRITSGALAPEHAHAAVDAAYEVAATPPSDWHKFGDSIHHLHAQKAQNADRLREMQGYLKEHQRTPKSRQIWPAHGERESRLAGSVDSLKDRQARIEQAIARHGKNKVRESATPAPRFSAPVAPAR